jgi:protein TonB
MPMMLQEKDIAEQGSQLDTRSPIRQRRQMLLALILLLAALIVVVGKDWNFWFPSNSPAEESTEEPAPSVTEPSESQPSQPQTGHTSPATPHTAKPKPHAPAVPAASLTRTTAAPSITASNRAALPPLEVEVVAGGQHTVLQPTNHSVKVDLQSGAPARPAPGIASEPKVPSSAQSASAQPATEQPAAVATNAGERVRLSPDTAQAVERPVEPNYPMLAKQMKVQGSVVLQALIGREGSIQDLRVLSGPAILSTAAMDAVKQWRFRPYFQSGVPVETEARITVNFTISTN